MFFSYRNQCIGLNFQENDFQFAVAFLKDKWLCRIPLYIRVVIACILVEYTVNQLS